MLTKAGTGKYLTKEFADLYAKGVEDRTQLTDEEIAWSELPDDVGLGAFNPDNFKVQAQPVDPFTTSAKTIDIRKRDACGDGED